MTLKRITQLEHDKEPLVRILIRIGRYINARNIRRDLNLYTFRKDIDMYEATLEVARVIIHDTLLTLESEEVQKEIKK